MDGSNSLEKTVRETEPLYRASLANRLYHNPYVRRVASIVAVVGLTAAGVHFLAPPEAVGTVAGHSYGFSAGFNDGLFAPINLALEQFLGESIAADKSGITSSPADGYYAFGFGTGVLTWKIGIIDNIINGLKHSRKAKN